MRQAEDVANFMDGHLEGNANHGRGANPGCLRVMGTPPPTPELACALGERHLLRRRGAMGRIRELSQEAVDTSPEKPWRSALRPVLHALCLVTLSSWRRLL